VLEIAIVTETAAAAIIGEERYELGEGPTWDAERGELAWVDIYQGRVHVYDPRTGRRASFDVGQPVGAAVAREQGGFALALRDGFAVLDRGTGAVEVVAPIVPFDSATLMNDGKCDSGGRFWAGTVEAGERPQGALYRLDPDGRLTRILSGIGCSNGIGWSPDDSVMYYVDTATQRVDVLDFDAATGNVENRRELASFPRDWGVPDGLAVDAEGHLWIAFWGGGCLRRVAPDGALDRVVELPASQVTSAVFAGADLRDLYVTSAFTDLPPERREVEPHAGALFRLRPGVAGLPTNAFRG
jgi:sugar lactone lactonase YvrE